MCRAFQRGMKGQRLVSEVLQEWEGIVKRVVKRELEVGEKMIVCGRSARCWNSEIKEKIAMRWQLYTEVISGRNDLWDEYWEVKEW